MNSFEEMFPLAVILRGGGGLERGGGLFVGGGCNVYIKNKLKSEILWRFTEKSNFYGGEVFMRNQYREGGLPKKGGGGGAGFESFLI